MIGVAILGYGTVGSGVQKILSENRGHIARMVGDEVRLTHVVDIRPLSNMPPEVVVTQRYEDVLEADEVKIVVECIGGAVAAYEFTRRALESGRSVVTSNKELVSTKGDELLDIARAHSAMYLYEASVGGGIPLLRPISQCLRANHILGVDGIEMCIRDRGAARGKNTRTGASCDRPPCGPGHQGLGGGLQYGHQRRGAGHPPAVGDSGRRHGTGPEARFSNAPSRDVYKRQV